MRVLLPSPRRRGARGEVKKALIELTLRWYDTLAEIITNTKLLYLGICKYVMYGKNK